MEYVKEGIKQGKEQKQLASELARKGVTQDCLLYTSKISIIDRKGRTDYPLKSKTEVAQDIDDRLLATLSPNF